MKKSDVIKKSRCIFIIYFWKSRSMYLQEKKKHKNIAMRR